MNTTNEEKEISTWKGSIWTAANVAAQIAERWGDAEAAKYDPRINCFTYNTWLAMGYQVKKGEKALKSVTFIPTAKTDKETGEEKITKRPRNVNLFYILQVKPIEQEAPKA